MKSPVEERFEPDRWWGAGTDFGSFLARSPRWWALIVSLLYKPDA
jgi:hypothetical protein